MKKNNLIIIGAGGHGRVVKDIALSMKKFKNILFLDDNPPIGVDVAGKVSDFEKYLDNAMYGFTICHEVNVLGSFAYSAGSIGEFKNPEKAQITTQDIVSLIRKNLE